MAEETPKAPAAPETEQPTDADRIGTVLMVVGVGLAIVIVADVIFKGRLLAPLFALLPAPRSSTTPEEAPDDGGLRDAAG